MKVGIIGAGTMGSGIAQAFAQSNGYEVLLCDINEEFAANGKNKIAKGLNGRVAKGKMEQAAADAILAKITTGTKEICKDCDLVIEAAIENMEIKKQTFQELSQICKPECMFATNTSSLSITEIGAKLDRPIIGMHFFNPVPSMKLVEITPVRELLYHPAELAAMHNDCRALYERYYSKEAFARTLTTAVKELTEKVEQWNNK